MTDQQRRDAQVGFANIALAFAERELPEDDGNWDLVGPPDSGDLSVLDILDHYCESDEILSETLARALELPAGSTYADGVKQIWEDRSHRRPMSFRTPRSEESAHGRLEG